MSTNEVVLHYIYPTPEGKIKSGPLVGSDGTVFSNGGCYGIACSPEQSSLSPLVRATDAATIVNCPKCKASEVYKEHFASPIQRQGGLESVFTSGPTIGGA